MKKFNRKFPRPKLAVLLIFCMLLPSFAWFGPVKGEAANAEAEDIFVTMPDNGSSVTDATYGHSVMDVTYATFQRMAMPRNANLPPASVTWKIYLRHQRVRTVP